MLEKVKAYAKKDQSDEKITAMAIDFSKPIDDQANVDNQTGGKEELMTFPADCYACMAPGECKMCIATIPYFKEIIIMAHSCDQCGHKSTEIKQGGGISEKAHKIVFDVKNAEDLNRDVFKSDSCSLTISEVGLEL